MKNVAVGMLVVLLLAAVGSGIWMGQTVENHPTGPSEPNDFEARLVELGLTESQINDTIVRGVEVFIQRQQQAQMDAQRQQQAAAAARLRPASAQDDYIRGAEDAAFSMIEYSDFECPFCKRFHATALSFLANNADLNWVHRHFPLQSHNPQAARAAAGAECLGRDMGAGAFWAFADHYYGSTRSGGRGLEDGSVLALMTGMGMSEADAEACLTDPEITARVELQMMEGQQAGVTGTPGIFIRHNPSGQVLRVPGAVPLPDLQERFDQFRASL